MDTNKGWVAMKLDYVLKYIVSFANMDIDQLRQFFTNKAKCMLILSKKPKYFIQSSLPTDCFWERGGLLLNPFHAQESKILSLALSLQLVSK